MGGLLHRPTTTTMNKTVIQYSNKTVNNYHDHTHDHVHLHGPGDWASLLIAVIVMVGVIIAVIAVACLVSHKKVIIFGTEKYRGGLKSVFNTNCQACTSCFSLQVQVWQHCNLRQTTGVGFQNSSLEMERFG